jgi:hypothetical protein
MSRVLNLRYKDHDITDTEILIMKSDTSNFYIDIHSDVISTTFGTMVKELTYMSALEHFEEDIVDDFINDIHTIVSLRRWLWEEKLVSSPNPAPGYRSNAFCTRNEAMYYDHKEIYSYVRNVLEKFIKKWSKYFSKLSVNVD